MLKYVSKIAMDILPSVVATILGAYIVNHYISNKPDAPVAAAVSPGVVSPGAVSPTTSDRPDSATTDVANLPQAGVRAKGISEKAVFEKPIAAKPVEKPQEKAVEKSPDTSEDKPAETASIPVEPKRPAPAPREKTAIRTIPLTATPATQPPAVAAPTVEAAVPPEDHRDANDLARAAIERLRGSNSASSRTPEAARAVAPQVPAPQQASAPSVRPLPPPIMVSTPPTEQFGAAPTNNSARNDDPSRPTPPADIPSARPLDLQAGAGPVDPPPAREREHGNVAQDMLLAAKSMFHAVLPQ